MNDVLWFVIIMFMLNMFSGTYYQILESTEFFEVVIKPIFWGGLYGLILYIFILIVIPR